MNDDAFARLVAEEIKNQVTTEQRDYLNLPENWARWKRAVEALADNLESQLDTIQSTEEREVEKYRSLGEDGLKLLAEVTAEFSNRRKKIERFRFHVITRLDEISRTIAMGTEVVEERMKTVEFLRKAIERHQEMMREYELEPTQIDIALWDTLNGRWIFEEITEEDILNIDN
jgi:pyruvate/2-oxoglutarate dehydrogenase complex dihydrolipoamide acyltransferase (E2) component